MIVGGGAAGCVVAARLSEDRPVRVCLVETGGRGEDVFVRAPAMLAAMLPGLPRINTYAYLSDPQTGLEGRRLYQPRGRALGGSTAINAMLYHSRCARRSTMLDTLRGSRTLEDWPGRMVAQNFGPSCFHSASKGGGTQKASRQGGS